MRLRVHVLMCLCSGVRMLRCVFRVCPCVCVRLLCACVWLVSVGGCAFCTTAERGVLQLGDNGVREERGVAEGSAPAPEDDQLGRRAGHHRLQRVHQRQVYTHKKKQKNVFATISYQVTFIMWRIERAWPMNHASSKVEEQPLTRSNSQLTYSQ